MTDLPGARATLVHRGAGSAVVAFDLAPDYPGFDGHFPGRPVLPGMCHLDLAVHAASVALGFPVALEEVERAKFTRAVLPGEPLRISLAWESAGEGVLRARVEHLAGGEGAADLVLLLRPSAGL